MMTLIFSVKLFVAFLIFLVVCLSSFLPLRRFFECFGDIESYALSHSVMDTVLWALFAICLVVLSLVYLIFMVIQSIHWI